MKPEDQTLVFVLHHDLRGPAGVILEQLMIVIKRFRQIQDPTPLETKLLTDFTEAHTRFTMLMKQMKDDAAPIFTQGIPVAEMDMRVPEKHPQRLRMNVVDENGNIIE